MIPQAAPHLRIARYGEEIDSAIADVVGSGSYILGPKVSALETAFAKLVGVDHCIGVASGTDALILALRAVGVAPGDEVITVSMTTTATAQAILMADAVPRFVDVDPKTWVMDAGKVEASIGPRTRAILPVHLYGHAAPVVALRALADRHGLALVEDCAHAHGARTTEGRLGSFGDAAAFSFYPTKNLGGVGDGGAVVTRDPEIAAKVRSLRTYGWGPDDRISHFRAGNSRLDEIQAAVLLVLLAHLEEGNRERREIAAYYAARLAGTRATLPPMGEGAVHHQFAIAVDGRDAVMATLAARGIGTAVHYAFPVHLQPAFANLATGSLPVTEALASRLLSLPIQPEVAGPNRQTIADAVVEVLGHS